jgi:hypothetical protein
LVVVLGRQPGVREAGDWKRKRSALERNKSSLCPAEERREELRRGSTDA